MQQHVNSYPFIRWIIILFITALSLIALKDIQIADNALELLPGEAVRGEIELLQRMGLVDRIFITLESTPAYEQTPQETVRSLTRGAEQVAQAISQSSLIKEVFYRLPPEYEEKVISHLLPYLPVLLSQKEFDEIGESLSPERLRQVLQEDFSLMKSIAGLPLKKFLLQDPLGFSRFLLRRLQNFRGEFTIKIRNGFFVSRDEKNCLIWAESALPLTDSKNSQQVSDLLQETFSKYIGPDIKVRVIGTLPHTLYNAKTIQNDLKTLFPLASIGLLIILLSTIRDIRVFLVIAIPFLAAPTSIAILSFIQKDVSAIALGFGIVLLGISVDFAVHLFLALLKGTGDASVVMKSIKRPMLIAFSTTLGVFIVLLISDVPSHRQMALLAIIGLILAVFLTWLLVPTIVSPKNNTLNDTRNLIPKHTVKPTTNYSKVTIIIWFLFLLTGIFSWTGLSYNGDLKTLDASSNNVKADDLHFRTIWRMEEDLAFLISQGLTLDDALNLNDEIAEKLQEQNIPGVKTIASILPGPKQQARNIAAWNLFWTQNRQELIESIEIISKDLGFVANAFSPFYDLLIAQPALLDPSVIMSGPMRPILSSMIFLPQNITNATTTINTNELALIATYVKDTPKVQLLASEIQTDKREASWLTHFSNTTWRLQVENLLRQDVLKLSSLAGILVFVITFCFFRKLRLVFATLAPILSALSAMAIFSYLTTRELNIMHVLMGIMVIGLSVDYGVFIVNTHGREIARTTRLSVMVCALSSLTGFGVLAFAKHPALHALGATVLSGISAALPTALWVTPLLIEWKWRRPASKKHTN